jgi:RNA polymerase sigma-B factor
MEGVFMASRNEQMLQTSVGQDPEDLVMRYLDAPKSDLRDLIVLRYTSQVERVARRFAGLEQVEDLVQVGYIGLLNALTKFDRTAGVRFNTYANYLIAGEIKHYLRDRSQTIRQPAWLQELRQKISKAQIVLQAAKGRTPTSREIAEAVGVTEESVDEVLAANDLLKVGSLDSTILGDDDGTTEVERLDAADFCPEQVCVEDRILLEHAMKELRELERQVLVMFHMESLTQTEIAGQLDISCNYVSHILRQSLAKLRKVLTSEEQKDRVLRRQGSSVSYEVLDQDTGVYTEEYFRNRLAEEIHRAGASNNSGVALILLDFDGLGDLRNFYGQQSVQEFLIDVADFLRDSFRRLDVLTRFGQTGFAVILPSTQGAVSVVRQRLIQTTGKWTKARLVPSGHIQLQIGTSCSPEDGQSAGELIAAASRASFAIAA